MVADSVSLLLDYPADLAANEIQVWTGAQFRSAKPAPVSDYLYHAMEKLHAMGQYDLVPKEPLHRYLEELKPLVVGLCPAVDRALLVQNLGRLGKTESVLAAPVEILMRQSTISAGGALAASGPGGEADFLQATSQLRELSLLIERLGPLLTPNRTAAAAGGSGGPGAGGSLPGRGAGAAAAAAGAALVGSAATAALAGASAERHDLLLAQILSVASMAARTDAELRAALDKLRSVGVDVP
ncbi:MAG TPA: hypothetical protein VFZ57_01045, partial [Thermoanaerobaculia bacterium]|nr:hypothetical protein [Thermoanaerobaculia bacterium]